MKPIYFICVIALCSAACSSDTKESPEIHFIKNLEVSLTLPGSAKPLENYNRTYSISPAEVRGVFIATNRKGIIKLVPISSLHMEMRDGGCGGIQVTFDRRKKVWTEVSCNGVA